MKRLVASLLLCALTGLGLADPSIAKQSDNSQHAFRFAPGTKASDRAAFLSAVTHAGPGARKIIHVTDERTTVGFVNSGSMHDPRALGEAQGNRKAYKVRLLRGVIRSPDESLRMRVILHELGHIVHHVLLGDRLMEKFAAPLPCQNRLDCSATERFADGFALWAFSSGDHYVGPINPSRSYFKRWGRALRQTLGV